MKRWIAGLLAALLIFGLCACREAAAPEPDEIEEPPAAVEPAEKPAQPEPQDPPSQPAQPEPPAPPAESEEPEPPAAEEPALSTRTVSGSAEAADADYQVRYTLLLPQLGAAAGDAAGTINAYYESAAKKTEDLCWELLSQAAEMGQDYEVTEDYTVGRFDEAMLSVLRTVTIRETDTGLERVTYAAETFDLASGGLMTADDFFAVDEGEYAARLAECVRRQISEDPYHDQTYFAQWEDLTERTFSRDQFYITEDAYVVFYQADALGGAAKNVFPIPWRQLEDLLA